MASVEPSGTERLDYLRGEFKELIAFHAESFKDIDNKAKYWLTICVPALIGATGYMLEEWPDLSQSTVSLISATIVQLTIAVVFFGRTIRSCYVDSGLVAPESRKMVDTHYFFEGKKRWIELKYIQAEQLLAAVANNEAATNKKSKLLGIAESLLFLGLPATATLVAGAAFAHSTACPTGSTTIFAVLPSAPVIGVAAGSAISVLIIALHRCSILGPKPYPLSRS
ncbi:MAG: hypothetical protein ACLFQF_06080 [Rhodosalinus sp.]